MVCGGGGMAVGISEIFLQRIQKVIFYKQSKPNKNNLAGRRGGEG